VQAYLSTLEGQAPATRANAVAALKSLLSFGQEVRYLRFNFGKVLKATPVKNMLADRILVEPDTLLMIHLEPNARNRALLTLLYGAGLRISEVTGLRWRDVAERDGAGQVTAHGKGGKTRVVLLSANTWATLREIGGEAAPDAPVFRSHKGWPLNTSQVHRIVNIGAHRVTCIRPDDPDDNEYNPDEAGQHKDHSTLLFEYSVFAFAQSWCHLGRD